MNAHTLREKTNVVKCSQLVKLGEGHICFLYHLGSLIGRFEIFQNKQLEMK